MNDEFFSHQSKKNIKTVEMNKFANNVEFKSNNEKMNILIDMFQFSIAFMIFETFYDAYHFFYEMRNKRYVLNDINLTI